MEPKINITTDQKELVIRTGEALSVENPCQIGIQGNIDSIINWLKVRKGTFDEKKCHILVAYDLLKMDLIIDEKEPFNTIIESILKLSQEFKDFGINNSSLVWDPQKLSQFIKMNRSFFESKDVAAKLVSEFKDYKMKVNKVVEKNKDDRANFDEKRSQAVSSTLPENFRVKLPIFKGMQPITIELEVYIDPINLGVSLISPETNDFIHEQTREIMDEQIKQIAELCPDIAIIYM